MTETVRAWQPRVPAVREVLHATFTRHAYPAHTHDAWTILMIDSGAVSYTLDRDQHHAVPRSFTILPPQVAHDGRSAIDGGTFRKRVLYLESDWLGGSAPSAAVRAPEVRDRRAFTTLRQVHAALLHPGESLAVENGVLALRDHIAAHLGTAAPSLDDAPLARRLRALLDDRLTETFTLADAAKLLDAHPSHLARAFSRSYGIAPHRYVTGRRVDLARRLLLAGVAPALAAVQAGFHDQAHLTRHFRRTLGTTPAAFAADTPRVRIV